MRGVAAFTVGRVGVGGEDVVLVEDEFDDVVVYGVLSRPGATAGARA